MSAYAREYNSIQNSTVLVFDDMIIYNTFVLRGCYKRISGFVHVSSLRRAQPNHSFSRRPSAVGRFFRSGVWMSARCQSAISPINPPTRARPKLLAIGRNFSQQTGRDTNTVSVM